MATLGVMAEMDLGAVGPLRQPELVAHSAGEAAFC
jgi:hypothetical protein